VPPTDPRVPLARHKRLLTLVVAGIVAVVMVIWGSTELFAPFPQRTTTTCDLADQVVVKTLKRSQVTVSIYNAGASAGTAGRFRDQFTQLGFHVAIVDNAPENVHVPVSEVVGTETTSPATRLVARTLGSSATVSANRALLRGPGVNIYLGPQHRPLVKKPPRSIALDTPRVSCLA